MIERLSTVLPEPDSPTMPRASPGRTDSDTPSTARTTPPRRAEVGDEVADLEQRPLVLAHLDLRSADVETAGQPVADEVEREHGEEQHQTRKDGCPPRM